jgi:membrane associated rhomboid family serine protease
VTAQLRHDGATTPVELLHLDEEVRAGRIPSDAELQHTPWTGDAFVVLAQIPELQDALDAPAARLARHFRSLGFPWASVIGSALILVVSAVVLTGQAVGGGGGVLTWLVERGAMGFEPIVLDNAWWSPWTSQLRHGGLWHLLPNMAVLGYSGWRVERALGKRGYALAAAAAVWGGAIAVASMQRMPVIGSSVLAFGFWGAQLAIGFRFGDHLPANQRRFYGYGNLVFFAILAAQSLFAEGVSHLAHAGGLIGGVIAALAVRPPHLVPQERQARAARAAELAFVGLVLGSFTVGPMLRLAPGLSWWPGQTVTVDTVGTTITLPGRLLPDDEQVYSLRLSGMPAWSTSTASSEVVFTGLTKAPWDRVQDGDPLAGEALTTHWTTQIDGTATPATPPEPLGPGWTAHALEFVDEDGVPQYRLVEHHLLRGRWLNRVGYVVSVNGRGKARAPVFEEAVRSVVVAEPPELAQARAAYEGNPTGERLRLEFAQALHDAGDLETADALYAELVEEQGRKGPQAVTERLALQALHAEHFPPEPIPWFQGWVALYPADRQLAQDSVVLLAHHGRCEEARAVHQAFAEARPNATELLTTAGAVLACEGQVP